MSATVTDKFKHVFSLIDAANSIDPRTEEFEGRPCPKELLYSHRMTEMLSRFMPQASEYVQIACRAQHIQRWLSPRDSQPMTREGYFKWRINLYQFHAQKTSQLMKEAGYEEAAIERVQAIVGKKNIKGNPETQTLEDVAGLVFIEYYMQGFAGQKADYSEEKWINIIKKTWNKLSEEARSFALSGSIKLPESLVPLIVKAIK